MSGAVATPELVLRYSRTELQQVTAAGAGAGAVTPLSLEQLLADTCGSSAGSRSRSGAAYQPCEQQGDDSVSIVLHHMQQLAAPLLATDTCSAPAAPISQFIVL